MISRLMEHPVMPWYFVEGVHLHKEVHDEKKNDEINHGQVLHTTVQKGLSPCLLTAQNALGMEDGINAQSAYRGNVSDGCTTNTGGTTREKTTS